MTKLKAPIHSQAASGKPVPDYDPGMDEDTILVTNERLSFMRSLLFRNGLLIALTIFALHLGYAIAPIEVPPKTSGDVVAELRKAKQRIFVQADSFSSIPIAKALADARKRKVKVNIILNKYPRSDRDTVADYFANAGITVLVDILHDAHRKNPFMVIDALVLIMGSLNFPKGLEYNPSRPLYFYDNYSSGNKKYIKEWYRHEKHSKPYLPDSER